MDLCFLWAAGEAVTWQQEGIQSLGNPADTVVPISQSLLLAPMPLLPTSRPVPSRPSSVPSSTSTSTPITFLLFSMLSTCNLPKVSPSPLAAV
jgi:hypothetical protein